MALDKMNLRYRQVSDVPAAREKPQGFATRVPDDGYRVPERNRRILIDAEMPAMDAYMLARHIVSDARFEGIPVVTHSSNSSEANPVMGGRVSVDAYAASFEPALLSGTLASLLKK